METTETLDTWQLETIRKNDETASRTRELYAGIEAYLPGWHTTEYRHDDTWRGTTRFKLESNTPGQGIDLDVIGNGKGGQSVHVSGWWPQRGGTGTTYLTPSSVSDNSPSINCSLTKGYQKIAADIERRFLPEYYRIWDVCMARVKADNDYETGQKNTAARILELMDGAARKHYQFDTQMHISLFDGYGDIHVNSAESVDFSIKGVPLRVAEEIAKLLARFKK